MSVQIADTGGTGPIGPLRQSSLKPPEVGVGRLAEPMTLGLDLSLCTFYRIAICEPTKVLREEVVVVLFDGLSKVMDSEGIARLEVRQELKDLFFYDPDLFPGLSVDRRFVPTTTAISSADPCQSSYRIIDLFDLLVDSCPLFLQIGQLNPQRIDSVPDLWDSLCHLFPFPLWLCPVLAWL